MNPFYQKMLRLIAPNLTILEIAQEKIKHQITLVIKAPLSSQPSPCKCCRANVIDENGKVTVVKNEKKKVTVRLESFNHLPNDELINASIHIISNFISVEDFLRFWIEIF